MRPALDDSRRPTLNEIAFTFVPFAVLFSLTVFVSLTQPEIDFARTRYTAWTMTILATPALCIFVVRFGREPLTSWWRLYWTFGYFACLAHFNYGLLRMHDADPVSVFERQGFLLAATLFLLIGLWSLDIVLTWATRRTDKLIYGIRLAAHLVAIVSLFISTVVFNNHRIILSLGILMTVSVLGATVLRLLSGRGVERLFWSQL